jgi:3-oxoacyl-[acyl-carrier protein] reductase
MKSLQGNIVLVTGASRGIGKALSILLCKKGATVIIASRTLDPLEEFQGKLKKEGHSVDAFAVDVCSEKSIVDLVGKIKEKYGKLDVLINNAGIGLFETVRDSKVEDAKKVFDTNVWGPMMLIQQVLPLMDGGSIVNISSAITFHGAFYQGVYSA